MNADVSTTDEHKLCLKWQTNEKLSLLPTFVFSFSFSPHFFWKCHTLDNFINNKFQNWFHFFSFFLFFFYYFTSTTPFRSEPVLRDRTCDASLVCIWLYSSFILSFCFVLFSFFFFLVICYLFSSRAQRDINCFKFMEKTKWYLLNERQSRVQQIWIQCRYPLVAYPIKESLCIKFFDCVRIDR